MNETVSNEIYLVGGLFRELYMKYNKMENKRHLYKDMKDLTLIEINTILVIGAGGMKSMSEIANQLGVSCGTPTVTIDRLITKGYVERIRDVEDRRQVFVKLSDKGLDVFRSVQALKDQVAEAIFGVLSPAEMSSLIDILAKLNSRFDEFVLNK